jgi:hypothetical protein
VVYANENVRLASYAPWSRDHYYQNKSLTRRQTSCKYCAYICANTARYGQGKVINRSKISYPSFLYRFKVVSARTSSKFCIKTARFCLLLLEPGETYFEDFIGLWLQKGSEEGVQGRLKLCSRSVVFEPRDSVLPLTKLPLQHCPRVTHSQQILTQK